MLCSVGFELYPRWVPLNNATCTVDFMIDSFNDGPPLSYACSLLNFSLICIFTIDFYQWARFCNGFVYSFLVLAIKMINNN